MADRIATYMEFWPHYLREHGKAGTRALHYVGSGLSLALLAYAIAANFWALALVPLAGYGLAWTGHGFVEGNRPTTFKYPWWSLISDYRMFGLWIAGRLGPHLVRAGVLEAPEPANSGAAR
jgi:hypothetical protein